MEARGVSIDDADMPDWARRYLSVDQLGLNRGLKWILLIYESTTLKPSRVSMAQRLHIGTEGRERKELIRRSHGGLAKNLNVSDQTAVDSLGDLEAEGWILVDRRPGRPSRYRLAWPVRDVLAGGGGEDVPRCGEPVKKGQRCTRRAGWGTKHQGVGKCKLHDDPPAEPPQPLETSEGGEGTEPPQPPETPANDTSPTIGAEVSNHWGPPLQPLGPTSPTVGDVYALSSQKGSLGVRNTSVLAVGELQDRNGRESRSAPSAQPKDHSFACRALIHAIPRYRDAPGWVRKQLIRVARAALNSGLGWDAIERYATTVIAERTFADHQHIPELRSALARLSRDVALGSACPVCANDPAGGFCCVSPSETERTWTVTDAADLERVLDALDVPPELRAAALAAAGTPTGTET